MTPESKLKIRKMFLELQVHSKEVQKERAAELLDYWVTSSREKHVRLVLPYVASLLRSGRPPSDSIPRRALERAEYFEKLIHTTPRDRSNFREHLLRLTAKKFSIEISSLERDIKVAKDYWKSQGCDVTGFCDTSRNSD